MKLKSGVTAGKPARVLRPKNQTVITETRKQRSDGIEARERLLNVALRLFAEKGYAKTSTREIARTADINLASIKYYFGDKENLYRAVFTEPMGEPADDIPHYDQPHFTLRQSLQGFLSRFLEPFKQGDLVQLCTRLHFREMLEPTGMWSGQIDSIKPAHEALVRVLARHLDARPDDELRRLAFCIAGLGLQMFITRDIVNGIQPRLINSASAIDVWASRLADYAEAMVAVEAARRGVNGSASRIKPGRNKKA
jgi:AcrR family transcriptional regulator